MSSFIGIINGSTDQIKKIRSVSGLEVFSESQFYTLFSSPASDRLFAGTDPGSQSAWVVSGIGIHPYPQVALLREPDWMEMIKSKKDAIPKLNGHFTGAILENSSLELFTDQIGMRSLFILQKGDAVLFSTRLDWLLPFSSGEIDWKILGENWLCSNAFSGDCFVSDIRRIHSNGWVTISGNTVSIQNQRWSPGEPELDIEEYLAQLTTSLYQKDQTLSLGLSGGLDSRLLLAALVGNSSIDFDLYTFSGLGHPDEKVASDLNVHLKKSHHFIDHKPGDLSLDILSEYTCRSMLNASVSTSLSFNLYREFGKYGKITIDGAIGEIGRRRFMRSLELRGRNAVLSKNPNELIHHFYEPKANIFTEEISDEMKVGALQNLEQILTEMSAPDPNRIGDWLDLFTIRTRLPSIAGSNQEIVDEAIFHLMPFVQPDLLSAFLNMPLKERSNARLFRRIIKKHFPESARIPLIKGGDSYPFWMNDILALIWMKIQRKTGRSYQSTLESDFLIGLEAPVRDLFASRSVKESGFYDSEKIERLLHSFYDLKDYTITNSINWMLCFELFRKRLNNESF